MKPVILTILDGFGYSPELTGNAVAEAATPNIDRMLDEYPHVLIGASGNAVGLPEGQMGNSEVGHLNIGAGRVVYQEITRIDKAIKDGEFEQMEALLEVMKNTPPENAIHIMGLVSCGKVHSSMNHLFKLLSLAKKYERTRVYVHAFTDGRDTSPHSGNEFIRQLENFLRENQTGKIASVCGRYYAMDRDNRWERTKSAYDAITEGIGLNYNSALAVIEDSYKKSITDEFIKPSVIMENGSPVGMISNGDGVIFFNFRADRGRQMTKALAMKDFSGFKRDFLGVKMVTLTEYDEDFHGSVEVAFHPDKQHSILAESVSSAGFKQLRITETEKYPHVTFFFNGGEEHEFPGEERILVPSPKVATYDLQPEMSAFEVSEKVVEALNSKKFQMIILNFANCDMVGHTGLFDAAVKAVETVDECAERVRAAAMANGYTMLLTADHGNAEMMIAEDGEAFTAHTTNPVHFIYIDSERKPRLRNDGALCNIAPTILEILDLPKPEKMTDSMVVRD